MSQQTPRPRFAPVRCGSEYSESVPSLVSKGETGGSDNNASMSSPWTPLIFCPADFPLELFEVAIFQLIHHPEYNSTLILRSEAVSETSTEFASTVPILHGFKAVQNVHRRLLPRRPGRDAGLEQHCTLYAESNADLEEAKHTSPSLLVLTPIVESNMPLPYYHPAVHHLAFRYDNSTNPPSLQIEVVPLLNTPTDMDSRLYRTCRALLETLHRYGWGAMTNYKKRVMHDCIVPREPYQDLYLVMRERHKHIVGEWQESTDPLKHVFEDIGIATFLILLWKDMYSVDKSTSVDTESLDKEPWRHWPRPPAGFLDLGCGNGLLTHILVAEGYEGHGIDLRSRTSWLHYPEPTQSHLHVEALDPTSFGDRPLPDGFLKPDVFIIGNHADELTPWVPILSTLHSASGYLSIPCCPWTFDTRYERSSIANFPLPMSLETFTETLNLGGDGSNTSAYSMYRIWLATLSLHCGWKVETETLRIPSTRNWALVGRTHTWSDDIGAVEARENVEEIVRGVQERGVFKTRRPEGKAGDH